MSIREEVVFGLTIERAKNKLDELFDKIIKSNEKIVRRSRYELITELRRIKAISVNSETRGVLLHVAYVDDDILYTDFTEYINYIISKSHHYFNDVDVKYF